MNVLRDHHLTTYANLFGQRRSAEDLEARASALSEAFLALALPLPEEEVVDALLARVVRHAELRDVWWNEDGTIDKRYPAAETRPHGFDLEEIYPLEILVWNCFVTKPIPVLADETKPDSVGDRAWQFLSSNVPGIRGPGWNDTPNWTLAPARLETWREDHAASLAKSPINGRWVPLARHEHGSELFVTRFGDLVGVWDSFEPTDDIVWISRFAQPSIRDILACMRRAGVGPTRASVRHGPGSRSPRG